VCLISVDHLGGGRALQISVPLADMTKLSEMTTERLWVYRILVVFTPHCRAQFAARDRMHGR